MAPRLFEDNRWFSIGIYQVLYCLVRSYFNFLQVVQGPTWMTISGCFLWNFVVNFILFSMFLDISPLHLQIATFQQPLLTMRSLFQGRSVELLSK